MLIVEGPDQIGKSHFCNNVLEYIRNQGFPVMPRHFGRLPKCWVHPTSYRPHISKMVVQDRFHMSEWVYRHAIDGTCSLTQPMYKQIDHWIAEVPHLTVVFTADEHFLENQWSNLAGRPEEFQLAENLAVNLGYMNLPEWMFYDYRIHLNSYYDYKIVQEIGDVYSERLQETRNVC